VDKHAGVKDISECYSKREVHRKPAEAARETHPCDGAIMRPAHAQQVKPAHRAAMRLVARIGDVGLPIVESARLSNAAARMMQAYQEAFLTLQMIRTGGKQTVVVQHVQVSESGQAVIAGNMKSGTGGRNDDGVRKKNGGYAT